MCVCDYRGLGYADLTVLTAWFSQKRIAKTVTSLALGGNPGLVGDLDSEGELAKSDVYSMQFEDFMSHLVLHPTNAEVLDLSGCGIGTRSIGFIDKWIASDGNNSGLPGVLKVNSTADDMAQVTYTLNSTAKSLDFKDRLLGVDDVKLLVAVSFQWKNPDFPLKNVDFTLRNVGFLLNKC